MKVDFGVHVKGRIVDSAFTLNFDPTYDKLLEAVQAATERGVRVRVVQCCGVSLSLCSITNVSTGSWHRRTAWGDSWRNPGDDGVVRSGDQRQAHTRLDHWYNLLSLLLTPH